MPSPDHAAILAVGIGAKATADYRGDVLAVTAPADGAKLKLDGSGRTLAHHRLRVTNATGGERAAQSEVASPDQSPAREAPLGFADFARDSWDLERLTHIGSSHTRMESSYDRTGGNQDGFNPARLRDNVYTIAELNGPGVVRRFYSARPNGRLQVFIDGSDKPVIDMPAVEFFAGKHTPFLRPAVGPSGFAHYSYIPIPYESR